MLFLDALMVMVLVVTVDVAVDDAVGSLVRTVMPMLVVASLLVPVWVSSMSFHAGCC